MPTKKKSESTAAPSALKPLQFRPRPFTEGAADVFEQYKALEWKHIALRSVAIRAARAGDGSLAREAILEADACFENLLSYVAVQCPYCSVPLQDIDEVHLSNCRATQERHAGNALLWCVAQCRKDFEGIQLKSWLMEYWDFIARSARKTLMGIEPDGGLGDGRAAVVVKKPIQLGAVPRRSALHPQEPGLQTCPGGPAVVSKKMLGLHIGRASARPKSH